MTPVVRDQLAQIQMAFLLAVATDSLFNPERTSDTMYYFQPRSIDWRTHALHTLHNTNSTLSGHISGPKCYSLLFYRLQQSKKHITIRLIQSTIYGSIQRLPMLWGDQWSSKFPRTQEGAWRLTFCVPILIDALTVESLTELSKLGLSCRPHSTLHLRTDFLGGRWEEIGIFNKRKIWKDQR